MSFYYAPSSPKKENKFSAKEENEELFCCAHTAVLKLNFCFVLKKPIKRLTGLSTYTHLAVGRSIVCFVCWN